MTVALDALVLPAFDDLAGLPSEAARWHETYDLDSTVEMPGLPTPLYHDGQVGVVPTGVGKAAAATTASTLLSHPDLDADGTLVLSVGVAGGPPAVPVGSVVVADTVVDWDDKCRFDGDLALNPYTGDRGVLELDPVLVERARAVGTDVDLRDPPGGTDPGHDGRAGADDHSGDSGGATGHSNHREEERGQSGDRRPAVLGGVNVCGDELWHGRALAEQVEWLLAERGVGTYRATEMEDAGTAVALSRFGMLDRYLTVRGISNHDRPVDGGDPRESFADPAFEAGFDVAVENAVRVGRAVLEDHLG